MMKEFKFRSCLSASNAGTPAKVVAAKKVATEVITSVKESGVVAPVKGEDTLTEASAQVYKLWAEAKRELRKQALKPWIKMAQKRAYLNNKVTMEAMAQAFIDMEVLPFIQEELFGTAINPGYGEVAVLIKNIRRNLRRSSSNVKGQDKLLLDLICSQLEGRAVVAEAFRRYSVLIVKN